MELSDIGTIIEIAVGATIIIGALYAFIKWVKKKLIKPNVNFTFVEGHNKSAVEDLKDALDSAAVSPEELKKIFK